MSSHVSWFYLFIISAVQQICIKWDHPFVETAHRSKPEDTGGWFSCPMLKRFFFLVFNLKNIFISYLNILFSMLWLCSPPLLPLPPPFYNSVTKRRWNTALELLTHPPTPLYRRWLRTWEVTFRAEVRVAAILATAFVTWVHQTHRCLKTNLLYPDNCIG